MTRRETAEHTIETRTHGRFLVRAAAASPTPAPLLVGFHGYMEAAEHQMERLVAMPGSERWQIVSVQALHRFYHRRSEIVVASWMTRQDRELAIADNLNYVRAVVAQVEGQDGAGPLVFAGFSQGVAMALRSAGAAKRPVAGVVAFGGDIPPELDRAALGRIPAVMIGRGERDEWYTEALRAADLARLQEAGVSVTPALVDAGHEWTDDFSRRAAAFLEQILQRPVS